MDGRTDPSRAVEQWLRDFVERALHPDEVEQFVRAVDDEVIGSIPEIAADPTLVQELDASTRGHWRNFLVAGLADEYRLALPPAAVALSQSIARRQLDMGVLLKVYRVANKRTFRYLTEHTRADLLPSGLPRDEALLTLWERAEAWIDESIETLITHFTRERAALSEGAQARRGELIEALLSGAEPSSVAERALGHNLAIWQTAFVLSASPANNEDTGTSLHDTARKVCEILGLPRPMVSLAASRELWGWVATDRPPQLEITAAAELLESLELHLAMGRSCHGPTAFRMSHLQAVAAQRVGAGTSTPCHAYGEVELVSLIGDTELVREMVRRELHPLLGAGKGDDVLRTTALAYLRHGQNVDATAQALFVHPNTVRYRVGRIEERLGRRITQRSALLEAGLAWLETYGANRLP